MCGDGLKKEGPEDDVCAKQTEDCSYSNGSELGIHLGFQIQTEDVGYSKG